MIKDRILSALQAATGLKEVNLEYPEDESFGDYSTNIALHQKSPRKAAEEIVRKLQEDKQLAKIVDKIEVAGPGFINLFLSKEALLIDMGEILKKGENFGRTKIFSGKRYLLEHTSPNTIKTLHVGHVRNNVLGMAVHNLLEAAGAEVKLDAINNDRGIHVMKAVWAYMKYGEGKTPKSEGIKPDLFVDRFYVMGAKMAEDEKNKDEMQELLRRWEGGDSKVREAWKKLRDWTLEGFSETYKRLGSKHDHQWYESDFYEHGKEMVADGLEKKVFRKLPDGAVITNLEKYGLPDTVVLRSDGTSMYLTQDLYLTKLKRKKFPSDLYIWDIGPEQSLYLKQLFTVSEQLGIGKRQDYFHLSYGFVYLKGGGKMSSRAGNVIAADWLMDEMVGRAKKIIEKSETGRGLTKKGEATVAEAVGIGAIKYGFLRIGRQRDIYFDMEESLSLQGNSGPYLQYTTARTNSVLAKVPNSSLQSPMSSRIKKLVNSNTHWKFNTEELLVLRALSQFPEVVTLAAKNYSPNLLANYLFSLAQKYNNFYDKHRILENNFRVALTVATGQVLKNGLNLFGIEAPERM